MPYGFIYITTNMLNGKKYLGQKKFDSHWRSYIGSGKAFKKAVQKYGKANFCRDIILLCNSADELNNAERDLSVFLNVVESNDWYNEVYGGGAMFGYTASVASRRKNALSHIGKRPSEEVRHRLSEAQKKRFANSNKHPSSGRLVSSETRRKMSEAHKGMAAGAKSVRAFGVVMIYPDGNTRHFGSIREAERETGANRSTIRYRISVKNPDKNGVAWALESEALRYG